MRPTLGVALTLDELAHHHAFVRDAGRDVELQDFINADALDDPVTRIARARDLLAGHEGRWGIHGPFWGFSVAARDPDIRAVIHKRLLQGLAVCEAIGGTHMVVHSPVTVWDHHNLDTWPGARDALAEAVRANLAPAVRRAEEIGCTLVLENIEDCDPHLRVALTAQFESPAIRVSLDTGHANYAHTTHGAPPVDVYVRAASERLAHVHIQDSDGRADRHWLPGEGNIPWKAVFTALGEATTLSRGGNDRPRLMVEVREKTALPAVAAYFDGLGLAA